MKKITEQQLKDLAGRLSTRLYEADVMTGIDKFGRPVMKGSPADVSGNTSPVFDPAKELNNLPPVKSRIDPAPSSNIGRGLERYKWIEKYGKDYNLDGTPKTDAQKVADAEKTKTQQKPTTQTQQTATTQTQQAPTTQTQQAGEKKSFAPGTLGLGSRGPEVKALQDKLIAAGLLADTRTDGKAPNDGIYGPDTQHAVQSLQDRLGVSKDGVYGPITQKALTAKPDALAPEKAPTAPVAPPQGGEASTTPDPRQQYDQFKADDAKAAAVADVKKIASTPLNNIPRFGIAIDPRTGQIFYGDAGNDTGTISPKGYPFKWLNAGGPAESVAEGDRIRASGLTIIDKNGYGYVDVNQLQQVISGKSGQGGEANTSSGPTLTMPATPAQVQAAHDRGDIDEAVSFQPDELNRIVSLVHYR
jgi:peptidoglycan hydrolase-like protein with peptidoglycan-binding domain